MTARPKEQATVLSCKKLQGSPLARDNFAALHSDGKALISQWLQKASHADNPQGSLFERFIYLWIAFNGLGSCLTGIDGDRKMVNRVASCPTLAHRFAQQVAEPEFKEHVTTFCRFFPIFKVASIRANKLDVGHDWRERETLRDLYLSHDVEFEPDCWRDHKGNCPEDWPHVLLGVYRVRNNLFHGEKSVSSEQDAKIVGAAYQVLANFRALWELGPGMPESPTPPQAGLPIPG